MLDRATLEVAGIERLTRCSPSSTKKHSHHPSIAEVADEQLQGSAYHGVHHVQCLYQHGILILSGRVPSLHHKQIAQEAVRNLSGVNEILNMVEVIEPSRPIAEGQNTGYF
jgi:osmotically-inducible protein OsmY